jgi:magnesium chelatase subunit D
VDATIRLAALHSSHSPLSSREGEKGILLSPAHLRFKQFTRKSGRLFVLTIDTSGSMAKERIEKARQVALGLLRRSYLRRDSVAIVVFRVDRAEVALPPSQSMLRAKRTLDSLAVGGGTPLCAGISRALNVVNQSREKSGNAVILLFTDGGANVPMTIEARGAVARRTMIESELATLGAALRRASINAVVLNTQNRFSGSNQARAVAENLRADYLQM